MDDFLQCRLVVGDWQRACRRASAAPPSAGCRMALTMNRCALSSPASRNRAAIRASRAFTRSALLVRPPLFSSPLPKRRYLPISNCRAGRSKARALTMCARNFDRSPSAYSGKRRNSSWLTTNDRTASPRNSNCSLSPGVSADVPAALPADSASRANDEWVSACSRKARRWKRCPRASSSADAIDYFRLH